MMYVKPTNGPLRRCHVVSAVFRIFHINQITASLDQIHHVKFSKYEKFVICWKLMENMEFKKLNLNICHARRQALVTDQYETLHVLVFGLTNRTVRLILFWNDMKK